MDKEIVAHIPNEILLSHRKEHIWVHSNQVGETGAYFYSELSQKQETPIQYINAYRWDLERW